MKTAIKTMALLLLVSVFCSATYIAAIAAEDIPGYDEIGAEEIAGIAADEFAGDHLMTTFSQLAPSAYNDGTRLGGNRISNIEGAPALRVDYDVVIPRVDLVESEGEKEGATTNTQAPFTGNASFAELIAGGVMLLCVSSLTALKGREEKRERSEAA